MAQKFHHYALNANKNLIHIKDTEGFENEKYYCPNCGDEMITKRGKVRNWHYAHKKADCSYDNYLHSLAELKIKDWFNREQTISLILDSHEQCDNHNTCKFYNKEQCKKAIQNRYNLKKFYTSCIIEHKYKGFIADIFCINKKENGEPIFIEIYVTHKCEEEKLNSGIRIIEIKIQNEEDIDEIISSNELKENKKIKLFNFKKSKTYTTEITQQLIKTVINKSHDCLQQNVTCKNYFLHRIGIFEITTFYEDLDFHNIISKTIKENLKKNCYRCHWLGRDKSGNGICNLPSYNGNPYYCIDHESESCSNFIINNELLYEQITDLTKSLPTGKIDVWEKDFIDE